MPGKISFAIVASCPGGSFDATIVWACYPMRTDYAREFTAVEANIPCLTSLDTARALVEALRAGDDTPSIPHLSREAY